MIISILARLLVNLFPSSSPYRCYILLYIGIYPVDIPVPMKENMTPGIVRDTKNASDIFDAP